MPDRAMHRSLSRAVYAGIRADILAGRYAPGAKLPGCGTWRPACATLPSCRAVALLTDHINKTASLLESYVERS